MDIVLVYCVVIWLSACCSGIFFAATLITVKKTLEGDLFMLPGKPARQ